tara:strand:+ start:470 stop:574 length:105 start_codon:yes stop_codon:yes gene_type:complete
MYVENANPRNSLYKLADSLTSSSQAKYQKTSHFE